MLSQISEKKMHYIRWVLAILWLILIASLFYDPISQYLTTPSHLLAPSQRQVCVQIQGVCFQEKPYPIGTRVFWNMVVPSAVMIILIFGHEFWRRICPLYFFSQIPRSLGLQPRLNIEQNQWLIRNHLYLQFAFLFLGLVCRILFINSNRLFLGLFLILTILSAIMMVYLYGGRSWCHYVCPFGPVQTVLTGPRGLLASEAHKAPSGSITQSMCRTIDKTNNQEISACIGCKSPCKDIDAEGSYWQELKKPGRKLFQYGYVGMVAGFFIYQVLFAGNFDYYFSGVWHHQGNQLSSIFLPGFYIFNHAIAIPKFIATPLSLAVFVLMSYWIGTKSEKAYLINIKDQNPLIDQQQIIHRVFSLCTFISVNMFFIYGGRGEILRLPLALQFIFQGFVVLVSTLWLAQIWGRTQEKYQKETLANFEDEPKANLIIAKPKVDERTQSRWTIERTERRHR